MVASESRGTIITFYSYKGGTGRSMALANVACILSQSQDVEGVDRWTERDRRVLMVDWDLDAPGLHEFFRERIAREYNDRIEDHPGLIDLFVQLDVLARSHERPNGEEATDAILDQIDLDKFPLPTTIPNLYLLKAGRFDKDYASRVNSFDWEAFHARSPSLIRCFAERLAQRYRYVLIDSRTGFSDVSGICTMLMPEKLVVVFTPNHQSLAGVLRLIQQATTFRKNNSDDLRPLGVFPLASRVEATMLSLLADWRLGNPTKEIPGYQLQFELLFEKVYDLPKCDLSKYFDAVQIQQVADYAFGEQIAILVERDSGKFSLTSGYVAFTERLVNLANPWEDLSQAASQIDEAKEARKELELADLYDKATLAFNHGNWQEAITLFSEIVEKQPGYREVSDRLVYAIQQSALVESYAEGIEHYRMNKWEDAIRAFERVARINSEYKDMRIYLDRAREQSRRSNIYILGITEFEQRRWAEAIYWFKQIRGHRDADVLLAQAQRNLELEELYKKGLAYYQGEKWTAAKKVFDEIEGVEPSYKDVDELLARIKALIAEQGLNKTRVNWEAIGAIMGVISIIATLAFFVTPIVPTLIPTVVPIPSDMLTRCLTTADMSLVVMDSQNAARRFGEGDTISLVSGDAELEIILDSIDCPAFGTSVDYEWSASNGQVNPDRSLPSRATYMGPLGSNVDSLNIIVQVSDSGFQRTFGFIIIFSR